MPADSPTPKPHPKQTIETILKAMEKKPDNFELDGETRLADIGFAKDDFENFTTYCSNAFNVKPHFDSSTQERLAQSGTVNDLEERVLRAVESSKMGSIGDK